MKKIIIMMAATILMTLTTMANAKVLGPLMCYIVVNEVHSGMVLDVISGEHANYIKHNKYDYTAEDTAAAKRIIEKELKAIERKYPKGYFSRQKVMPKYWAYNLDCNSYRLRESEQINTPAK